MSDITYPITIIEDAHDLHAVQSRVSALLVAAAEAASSGRTHLALGNYARALERLSPLLEAAQDAMSTAEPLGIWVEDQERADHAA